MTGDRLINDPGIAALRNRAPSIIGHESSFKSAVLLPLVYYDSELSVLFERRAFDLDVQPGEVCFPGGGVESQDPSMEAAAIRETCEELNLKPKDVKIIAPLDLFVSPFNMIIYPFAGFVTDFTKITINRQEVEYCFAVPLKYLRQCEPQVSSIAFKLDMPDDYPWDLVPGGRNYPYRSARYEQYFYQWNGEVIWGMTARILKHFLDLVG